MKSKPTRNSIVEAFINDCLAIFGKSKTPDIHPKKELSCIANKHAPACKISRVPVYCVCCGSKKIAKVQYGVPATINIDAIEAGEVILGGCIISDDSPTLRCFDCGQGFIVPSQ